MIKTLDRSEEVVARALDRMNEDRYMLSIAVFQRISELTRGAKPLVDMDIKKYKPADIAIHEIADGFISIESITEKES